MVGEHVAEELAVDDEDVVEIMQVVQMLRHQVTQLAPVPVPKLGGGSLSPKSQQHPKTKSPG